MPERVLIQGYDENHDWLAEITLPRMRAWCDANGWEHRPVRFPISLAEDYNFRKYPLVLDALNQGIETVVWCDLDVVPVSGRQLETHGAHISISLDRCGICAGFVAYENSEWTRQFVTGLLAIIPKVGRYHCHEQECLKAVVNIGEAVHNVRTIPESVVANPCTPLDSRPTFFHLWANRGRAMVLNEILKLCI